MHDLTATTSAKANRRAHPVLRTTARWMVSFLGFPLGGFVTMVFVGPVNTLTAALIGGLVAGAILGAAQSWGMGRGGPPAARWIAATGVGLMAGLGLGSAVVDHHTDLPALLVQGAISGCAVGVCQALVLRRPLGPVVLVWPVILALVWPLGWFVTTSTGVAVGNQFTVFGSIGAVVVTALTVVLPLTLTRRSET